MYLFRNIEPKDIYVNLTGIKTAGRNINNLRNANDTILTAESKEELKSLLKKVKVKRKCWLKTQHSKN